MSLRRTPLLCEAEAAVQPRTKPSLFSRVKAAGQSAAERVVPALRRRREDHERQEALRKKFLSQKVRSAQRKPEGSDPVRERAEARVKLWRDKHKQERLADRNERAAKAHKKLGNNARAALHATSAQTARERAARAQRDYRSQREVTHKGSDEWLDMIQHAHDIKKVDGVSKAYITGPHKPAGSRHDPSTFQVGYSHPDEMGAAKTRKVYYTADKLVRGPLLIEGMPARKPEPGTPRTGPGFTQRLLGRAKQAVSQLQGKKSSTQPSPVAKRSPRAVIGPAFSSRLGDPKAETRADLPSLPGGHLSDDDRRNPRKARVRTEEVFLAMEAEAAKKKDFDPHADWFKQPVDPKTSATISQHFKSLRDPVVVARLKKAGQQVGARTVAARRAAGQRRLPSSQQRTAAYERKVDPHTKTQVMPAQASTRQGERPGGHTTQRVKVLPEGLDKPSIGRPRTPMPPFIAKRRKPRKQELAQTEILPHKEKLDDLDKSSPGSRRGDTKVLKALKSWNEVAGQRLDELVTAGGVFATGLKPGDPIVSHPRDLRDYPPTPRKGGAVTTRDVGHTANTGAWVPDKKKREIKIPKPEPIGSQYRAIEKDFEAQPSNTGGVLTIMRKRPGLLGS